MTKTEINVQPALTEMTDRALEDRWLNLAVLEDQMTTAEARAWARDLMEKVSTELAKRQK
jgi:hypothetical protein